MRQVMSEALESRVMMSAGGSPSVLSTAVRADRLLVKADLLVFRSDADAGWAKLLGDLSAIKADQLKKATTVVPLVKQFRKDVAAMRLKLKGDRLAESGAVLKDESTLVLDQRQKLLDRGNATAVAADRAKILADRIKIQGDIVAGLNQRIADRTNAETTIFNDGQAIVAAAGSDPNASPALAGDLAKFVADRTGLMTTLTGDLGKLATDRGQLVADLTAMQGT